MPTFNKTRRGIPIFYDFYAANMIWDGEEHPDFRLVFEHTKQCLLMDVMKCITSELKHCSQVGLNRDKTILKLLKVPGCPLELRHSWKWHEAFRKRWLWTFMAILLIPSMGKSIYVWGFYDIPQMRSLKTL